MLTEEAEANQSRAWSNERLKLLAIVSRMMTSLDWTEAHYGPLEIDNARPVIVTQDEHGNVRVAKES